MICPHCGYDMGSKSKCLRCGYVAKTLAVVNEQDQKEEPRAEEKIETKVIDPCNVYLTHPYGYEDDFDTGFGPIGSPFSSLFDELFGDPIGDLLGGLFGINLGGTTRRTVIREQEPPKKKRKQGPVVEVDNVEIIDESGSKTDKVAKENTSKNPFKKKNKDNK